MADISPGMQLVQQAATAATDLRGEREQRFEALFREHSRAVLGFALRRVARREEAADVLSEVMLVAWRRLDEVPGSAEARIWLYAVARRVLANHARATSRRTRLGERLRDDLSRANVLRDDLARRVEARDELRTALLGLSEEDRELLLLASWEGLEPSEIALILDLAPGTVRTRLHRARGRLRERLASEPPAPPAGTTDDDRNEEGS